MPSANQLPVQPLPDRPNQEQQKKRARELLKAVRAGDPEALRRFRARHPRLSHLTPAMLVGIKLTLGDAQLVIAREYGSRWRRFSLRAAPTQRFKMTSTTARLPAGRHTSTRRTHDSPCRRCPRFPNPRSD